MRTGVPPSEKKQVNERQTCCKQRRELNVINVRSNKVGNACDGRRFRIILSYLSNVAHFNLLQLHLAAPLGVTPFELCRDLRRRKTKVFARSSGVICVILRLAVSVEHRLMTDRQTDRQTDTRRRHNTALAVARKKQKRPEKIQCTSKAMKLLERLRFSSHKQRSQIVY